jgi:hypothetical protein
MVVAQVVVYWVAVVVVSMEGVACLGAASALGVCDVALEVSFQACRCYVSERHDAAFGPQLVQGAPDVPQPMLLQEVLSCVEEAVRLLTVLLEALWDWQPQELCAPASLDWADAAEKSGWLLPEALLHHHAKGWLEEVAGQEAPLHSELSACSHGHLVAPIDWNASARSCQAAEKKVGDS